MTLAHSFLATIAAAVMVSQPSLAEVQARCDEGGVVVTAPTNVLASRSCSAASTAFRVLSECGIRPAEDVRISVQTTAVDGLPHCLGSYNCDTQTLQVLTPAALAELQATSHMIWRGIDPARLFDSLIVHEMTHASLDQADLNDALGTTGHEYIAYVMQLRALSDAERAQFLADQQAPPPDTLEQINIFVLLMAPGVFAAQAWMHFDQPQNGCGFVELLMEKSLVLKAPENDR